MNPNHESEKLNEIVDGDRPDDNVSVDDFIKQLEAREKDLHITANTTIIEIEEGFDDGELPDFMKGEFVPAPAAAPPPVKSVQKARAAKAPSSEKFENEIASLKEKIQVLEASRDELKEASLRRSKDFENFKTRTERERKETFQNQLSNLASRMLPALDNLNRAVDFGIAMSEEQAVEVQQFFDGVVLVNQQVNEVFAEMGILPIATVGEMFDPHYHEAVATEESDDFEPNTISAELLRGYRIGDRVVRHSMVRVVKGPATAASQIDIDPLPADELETDPASNGHDTGEPEEE